MGRNRKQKRIPESRIYVHLDCDTETVVSGSDFRALADPFALPSGTFCVHCEEHFPLTEFEWQDTGERISDAKARWAAQAPPLARLVCSRAGCLSFALLGLLVGGGIGGVLGALAGHVIFVVIGATVVGMICAVGALIVLFSVVDAVTKRVYGVDDVRLLE